VKSLVKVVTDTVAPPDELPVVVVVEVAELLLQAAASRPPTNNRGTKTLIEFLCMSFPNSGRNAPTLSVRPPGGCRHPT
jgi:hypothetical protein